MVLLLAVLDLFLEGIELDAEISWALSLVSNLTSGFLTIGMEEMGFRGLDTSEVHNRLTGFEVDTELLYFLSYKISYDIGPGR